MKRAVFLCFALTAILSTFLLTQTIAGSPPPQVAPLDLEQQVLSQGPMLLGNLRQAREEGLRRDPWGMAYSLQEARRVLDAMATAERSAVLSPTPGQLQISHSDEPGGFAKGCPGRPWKEVGVRSAFATRD